MSTLDVIILAGVVIIIALAWLSKSDDWGMMA